MSAALPVCGEAPLRVTWHRSVLYVLLASASDASELAATAAGEGLEIGGELAAPGLRRLRAEAPALSPIRRPNIKNPKIPKLQKQIKSYKIYKIRIMPFI